MLVEEQAALRMARLFTVEPLNVWACDAFWGHVDSVMEFERAAGNSDPKAPTETEMMQAYLMAWILMSPPAGNA